MGASVSVIFSTSKTGDGTATSKGYQAHGGHGPPRTDRRQDRRPSYWHLLCQQDPWHPVEESSWTPAPWRDQVEGDGLLGSCCWGQLRYRGGIRQGTCQEGRE